MHNLNKKGDGTVEWKVVNYLYNTATGETHRWDELTPEEQEAASKTIHRRLAEAFGVRPITKEGGK